jgi:hypothetical protein
MTPVKAFTLVALGPGHAAMGIYVAGADELPIRPNGLAPAQPLPGNRATFDVPRADDTRNQIWT